MKALIIIPSTKRGGVEEYSLKIAKTATQAQWEVSAAFPSTEGMNSLIGDLTQAGISYYPLSIAETDIPGFLEISNKHQSLMPILKELIIPRVKFDLSKIPHFFKTLFLLIKLKPNVVMIVLPWPDFGLGSILACGFLQIPTFVVFQLVPYPLALSTIKLKLYHWAHQRKQQWVGVSLSNCQSISQSFQIPKEQVSCIYNGAEIKAELAEDISQLRYQVRKELNLSEDTKIALTVARLSKQKGHDFLIPAIPHLTKEFPDLKFVWVGDGEEKESLLNLLKQYKITEQVLCLGYRSDIPRLLQAADLFVFPTYYEGQPFALLEAMAYGLPVITTITDGIPEVIEHKVHGLLIRKGDSCALLEAIRWALHNYNLMQIMAENAQLRVKYFSEDKMLKQTLDLLENLSYTN